MTSPLTQPIQHSVQHSTGSIVQIEEIRNTADWATLASEWNVLLRESHNNVPFLTYEFQRAWWDHLGGGEWNKAELNIVLGRDQEEKLIGIAPLFSTEIEGQKVLQFIGSHEIADFLDLIVRPQDHAAFSSALADHLVEQKQWQRVELYNLLDSSPTSQVLKQQFLSKNLNFDLEPLQPSPYIEVPSTYEAYVDSLDPKQAHELRRKMRRAARNPEPIAMEIVDDAGQLDRALDDFFALMAQEADKAAFLKPAMRAQMDAIAHAAFAAGWLQLAFLKCGDARIAGYMNFDYDNCIWAYNAGFDNEYAYLSPGWIMLAEMMKWNSEHGRRIFDFMRGDEEYKYRFGGKDRFVQKAVVSKPS